MPICLDSTSNILAYEGTLKRFFKSCPKPDGWFGCFFTPTGSATDIMIKGNYPKYQLNELREGNRFNVILQETSDANIYQIKAISLVPSVKHLATMLKNIKGIGSSTVNKIVDAFGENALDVIKNDSSRLSDIGISDKKVKLIVSSLSSDVNIMRMKVLELAPNLSMSVVDELLCNSGSSDKERFDKLLDEIKNKPYKLFIDYSCVSFKMADEIALSAGFDITCDERIAAAMYYVMKYDFRAKVYIDSVNDKQAFVNNVCVLLGKSRAGYVNRSFVEARMDVILASDFAKVNNLIMHKTMIYEYHKFTTEIDVANRIKSLLNGYLLVDVDDKQLDSLIDLYERKSGQQLDSYQREAVKIPFKNRLSTITGGPGRGKSSVAKCIIFIWEYLTHHSASYMPVQLCAPTGKACNRLSEATCRTNVKTAARFNCMYDWATHHTNLKKAQSFLKETTNNLVIVDESSMIGLDTARDLLEVFADCHIVFMGDTEQLPSIEYGQFFKDLYDSPKVPTATLVINHRSTGVIVTGADMINAGTHIEFTPLQNDDTYTFYNTDAFNGQVDNISKLNADWIVEKYVSCVYDQDFDKMRDNMMKTCILSPSSKNEDGVSSLNKTLQERLNPTGQKIDSLAYVAKNLNVYIIPKVHDRVIFTRNDPEMEYYNTITHEFGLGISNGDCGVIDKYYTTADNEEYVKILMDDGRMFEVLTSECEQSLELAYAMTIHKAQGSEYDTVIIAVQHYLRGLNSDFATINLMYTAITRAKNHCIMYGSMMAMNHCIDTKLPPRNSRLVELIAA